MRLILIRHAETAHNRDNRAQGQADNPLSDIGERQAAALGRHLAGEPLTAVYTSPLQRARSTALAVAAPHGLTPVEEADLLEMNLGEMEGLAIAEMRDRFPEFLREWASDRGPELPMPGGESLVQVQARAWAVIERLREAHGEDTVALVSHNFVLGTLISRALGMPLHEFRRFRLSVAGATTLRFRPTGRIMLERLNDTCHFAAAGLTLTDPWPVAGRQ